MGYFNTCTVITAKDIQKMTKSGAKIKVYIAQSRKNTQSKTTNKNSGEDQGNSDPVQEPDNDQIDLVTATVDETHKIYTDQTGKLPIKSSRGNKYIRIMYVYDANSILASPLKIRSGSHILEAYTKQVAHIPTRRYRPRVHWLDNESSASLKKYKKQKDIGYQLVPPYIHRVNAAEWAIRAWRDKFIAGISSTDTHLPMPMCC